MARKRYALNAPGRTLTLKATKTKSAVSSAKFTYVEGTNEIALLAERAFQRLVEDVGHFVFKVLGRNWKFFYEALALPLILDVITNSRPYQED